MRKAFVSAVAFICCLYCYSQKSGLLLPVSVGDAWGYVNEDGKLVITPQYDYAEEFVSGYAKVYGKNKIGVLNQKGLEIIHPQYDEVTITIIKGVYTGIPYSKIILHKKNGKWGCSDTTGRVILENNYNYIYAGELLLVKNDSSGDFFFPVFFLPGNKIKIPEVKVNWVTKSGSYYIFKSLNYKQGVLDAKGNVIIQPLYDDISYSDGRAFIATSSYKKGIVDDSGKVRLEMKYSSISAFENHLAQVISDGLYGMINDQFEVILEPGYSKIVVYDGMVKAKKKNTMTIVNVDSMGNVLDRNEYSNVSTISVESYLTKKKYSFGPISVIDTGYVSDEWFRDDSLKKWGLLGSNGDTLIKPTFRKVHSSRCNNYALVEVARPDTARFTYGMIPFSTVQGILDPATGKAVVPIRYFNISLDDFLDTSVMIIRCLSNLGEWGYLEKDRKYRFCKVMYIEQTEGDKYRVLKSGKLKAYSYGFTKGYYLRTFGEMFGKFDNVGSYTYYRYLCCTDGKWCYLKGDSIHPEEFEFAGLFKNKRAIVRKNGKWGVINDSLNTIVPFAYDSVSRLSNSGDSLFKLYVSNSKYGLINKDGKVLSDMIYDHVNDFGNGFCSVKKNSLWGFIDRTGKEVTDMKYEGICDYSEWLAAVKLGGKWGYIDTTGNMVIEPAYKKVEAFSDGMAFVTKKNTTGYINTSGDLMFELKCSKALKYLKNVAWIKQNGRYGLIDKSGKWIIKPRYNDVDPFCQDGGLTIVNANSKFGIVDNTGEVMTPYRYSYIGKLSETGFAVCIHNGKYGFIDKNGTVAIDAVYDFVSDFSSGYAIAGKNNEYMIIGEEGKEATGLIKSECIQKYLNPDAVIDKPAGCRYNALELSEAINSKCYLAYDTINNIKYFLTTKKEKYHKYLLVTKETNDTVEMRDTVESKSKKLTALQNKYTINYTTLSPIGYDLRKYRQKMVYGIADYNGNIVFKPVFENIYYCTNGVYKVISRNLLSYLKSDGTWIWKPAE